MEKKHTCYLFVFNGFADWEPALVTSGLMDYSDFTVKTFSFDGLAVRSMGNLLVTPDLSLEETKPAGNDLVLLPGGEAWEIGANDAILDFVTATHQSKTSIAAICAATTILAKAGVFDELKHTSNGHQYLLSKVPGYAGQNNYVNDPAVSDGGVITANGAAMIEFAKEIFNYLGVMTPEEIEGWKDNFKSGGMLQVSEQNQ